MSRYRRNVTPRAVTLSALASNVISANEITDNAIPPSALLASRSSRIAKGCPMNRADPLIDVIASQQNPVTDVIVNSVEQRSEGTTTSLAEPMPRMIGTAGARRQASPVRLTLASRLGNEIDGAWWPRTELISRELPELVSILEIRLGQIIDINVNWSPLQGQPNLNWDGWQGGYTNTSWRLAAAMPGRTS